jgi:predicted amidohydrolase YtcJ
MKRLVLASILILPVIGSCKSAGKAPEMESDLVISGATVFTGTERIDGGWVAVRGANIAAVGRGRPPQAARQIDGRGLTVLSGLTDAHAHLYGLGLSLDTVSLVGTTTPGEAVERVRQRAAQRPAGEWILGRGWDQNDWPVKEFPTAELLDAASVQHPIWLRRIDGHAGWANRVAMAAANITPATPDPPGGKVHRDPAGNPTGVFVDAAMGLIDRIVPPPSAQLRKERIRKAAEMIAAHGLTEIHDAGASAETIAALRELIDQAALPIRVYLMLDDDEDLIKEWLGRGPLIDYGGRLTIRSIKMYADGALGSRGAALLQPYSDDPDNQGLLLTGEDRIAEVALRARQSGFQVNTHAIGDRGNRVVLNAYERAGISPSNRFRIEHLQVIALEDIPRLAQRGIIASMQPTHATSDMYWAQARVGPERIAGAYAWRKVLHAGGPLALGSDFPVEDVNPLFGIYAAVTRQDQKGWPAGGWYPQERLTLEEAIRGFTINAASAAFEETSRGTIEPGKLADFTIVEGNLFAIPEPDLYKVKVRYTVVGGEVVYDAVASTSRSSK